MQNIVNPQVQVCHACQIDRFAKRIAKNVTIQTSFQKVLVIFTVKRMSHIDTSINAFRANETKSQ